MEFYPRFYPEMGEEKGKDDAPETQLVNGGVVELGALPDRNGC